ncbi:amine-terminal domain cyclin (macronuclear) [Tetrahymena thermophila SB210]|uniref:Amine-terminal domain cyclin n=1 Tax=Tetrahymena thermophila (strain SB210) TaxID=312017 RepID=I7MK42_TETTS|nr:amine-terminal domain cyclin [Tetrahymena thermophila SB210]EAS07794.2 amine-terminal domain cyclin [Tetrahymena thermophila SB210]|eukprot:XP_001028036.2 amine-terminal domain cyclin [Tetrahymena thermophila SB210]
MKLDSKNIISQQSQSEQFPIISSQETQSSSYKTIKKKIVTKLKLSASGSTQYTDSSQYKRSAKLSKAKDLNKKIIFDDYPSQSLELTRTQMDAFSQESHIPSQLRILDTQSQNFGYCHSQLDDDNEMKVNNQYQAILENENQYQMHQHIYQNDDNSNSCVFQQTNYDSINIQQYNQNLNKVSRKLQNVQDQPKNISQREMIAESVSIQSHNQSNNNENNQNQLTVQKNESHSNECMEYNDENQMKTSQQQIKNNINRSERVLLGEITQQLKPLQSPQLEEEFQFNNNNYFQNQEEEQGLANFRTQQNQFIQEDNHGSLFYPCDDVNFIENDEFNYDQYNNPSLIYNPMDDLNRNCFQFFEASNSQQFQKEQAQPQRKLTMREMLDQFNQEDTFSFDDQDLQNFEIRQSDYIVDPQSLQNYNSNFTNFAKKRAILIDWMQEVSTGFSFKRETYQQSISIIDRYFERVQQVPKNQLQLVGATALLIAHKIEEVICKKNEEFITICNGGYTNSQFIQMEIDICLKLKFELNTPTPYFIMNQLMLRWDGLVEQYKELFDNDIIFFKKNNQKSFLLFSKVCQYIDCSYYNIYIYNYPIKYVIALFMYSTLCGSLIQNRDIDVKLSHLNQLFDHFIQNTLNLESCSDLQNVKLFTDQFMDLNICDKVPITNQYINRQDDKIYESYENVCSQQLYNRDFKRLFGIGD